LESEQDKRLITLKKKKKKEKNSLTECDEETGSMEVVYECVRLISAICLFAHLAPRLMDMI
jgi:hypothetical protein